MRILWYVIFSIVLDVVLLEIFYGVFGRIKESIWQRGRIKRRGEQSRRETLGGNRNERT
jgi:hypothetical protein